VSDEPVRTPFLPGEEVTVRLTREGREWRQIGADVRVTVTNVVLTTSGRMVFARLGQG
jgi:uncharacterized protein YacL